jgi:hypothetical protein
MGIAYTQISKVETRRSRPNIKTSWYVFLLSPVKPLTAEQGNAQSGLPPGDGSPDGKKDKDQSGKDVPSLAITNQC